MSRGLEVWSAPRGCFVLRPVDRYHPPCGRVFYKKNLLCGVRIEPTTYTIDTAQLTRRERRHLTTSRIAIHSRRTRIAEAAIRRRDQPLERAPLELSSPNNQAAFVCARKRFGIRRSPHSTVAQCRGLLYGTRYVSLRPLHSVLSLPCGMRRPPWRLTVSARTSALALASSAPLSRGDHTLGTSCTMGSLVGASSTTDAC